MSFTSNFSDEELLLDIIDSVDNYLMENLSQDDNVMDGSVRHLPNAGGKRLRPSLFLLSVEYLGGNFRDYVPLAAGIESLHTSSLIQDDLPEMDDDELRRGVESVHNCYGSDISILASNVLRSKATTWTTRVNESSKDVNYIVEQLDTVVEQMCHGQRLDLCFNANSIPSEREYLDMVYGKTARLYEFCGHSAGFLMNIESSDLSELSEFGRNLGTAFQLTDDVIDFEGGYTGKDAYTDLASGKVTIVTLHCSNQGFDIFSSDLPLDDKLDMVETAGSIEYASDLVSDFLSDACNNLENIDAIDKQSKDHLLELVDFIEERKI